MRVARTIYNNLTGDISRVIIGPEDEDISTELGDNESAIVGNYGSDAYKIDCDNVIPLELSTTEINNKLYSERENTIPPNLDITLSDEDLNTQISEYFLEQVDVETWRIGNYAYLRKQAYPSEYEKLDAEVKIGSGIEALAAEGELQLQDYIEDCINVKMRFLKE